MSETGLKFIKTGTGISIIPIHGPRYVKEHPPNILYIEFHEDIVT
jgi:hypothetical protein